MTKHDQSISIVRKLIVIFPLAVLLVLGAANIVFSSQMVTQGKKIHTLEAHTVQLSLQEKDLETELAGLQSLRKIKNDAMAQGYIPISSAAYVDGTRPVALRQ